MIIPVKSCLFIFFLLSGIHSFAQKNPYVGTWEAYQVRSKHTNKICEGIEDSLRATIILKRNMTFTQITRGLQMEGTYSFSANQLIFVQEDDDGDTFTFQLEWPENTTDPTPETEHPFDINFPELILDDWSPGELNVYYVKKPRH